MSARRSAAIGGARRLLAAGLLVGAACGGSDEPAAIDAAVAIDAGDVAGHTLAGLVAYEDRRQQANGRLATTIELRAARAISISLIADVDGAVLATTTTGDNGRYALEVPAGVPGPVYLLAAAMNASAERPIQVVRRDRQAPGFGGRGCARDATAADLLITEASGEAEAFNVFDMAVLSHDAVRVGLGITPQRLTAVWEKGSTDGTYYSGDRTIHLLGSANDDDGYDDTVILHEIGHFFEHVVGRTDSPGGSHDGSPTDPNLAWSEGFATYWAMAVKQIPFYGDSNAGGGWGYNGEVTVTRAPQPAGDIGQDVAENMTTEVLWDLGDASATDDDPLAGDHLRVEGVQPTYLRTAALRAAGEAGVDLVDFLDGFFVADGLTRCAEVRQIVVTSHAFPYDFGGPAGACP